MKGLPQLVLVTKPRVSVLVVVISERSTPTLPGSRAQLRSCYVQEEILRSSGLIVCLAVLLAMAWFSKNIHMLPDLPMDLNYSGGGS